MAEENYHVYDYRDELKPGEELRIEHSLRAGESGIDELVGMDEKTLEGLKKDSVAEEEKIFRSLQDKAGEWAEKAYRTKMYDRALTYLHTPEVQHTSNRWVENEYHNGEHISNMVYRMGIHVYEDVSFNRATQELEPVAWYVSWHVSLNLPGGACGPQIAGQDRKRYTDHDAAMKYIEGRKKAYADLFSEISPPIPEEYASNFKVYGVLLPGYSVGGEEKGERDRAAAEMSDGGLSASGKRSVLEKLDGAKAETKRERTGKETGKVKEETR